MQGLRKKMLLSILVFTMGLSLSAEKSRADEVTPNHMPLKMSFYYTFPVLWGSLSDDRVIYVFRLKDVPTASADAYERAGPELITPSLEDWEAFYDACVSADIWDLGREGQILSEDIAVTPMHSGSWSLSLEYPDRKLDINGKHRIVDIDVAQAMDLPGLDQDDEDFRWIISDNIDIVMEYEKIQSVWDAFGKYIIRGKKFPLLRKF